MRTLLIGAVVSALAAWGASAEPRIWLEHTDMPEALMAANDTGEALDGCLAEWTITYGPDSFYTQIAMVDLPATGEVEVSNCANWWNQSWHKSMDVSLRLLSPEGDVLAEASYVGVFRMVARQGLPTEGWSATSSTGANVRAAFDDDLGSRWDTGRPQRAGDRFELDMGVLHEIHRIVLDARNSSQDYPGGLKVEVSEDGRAWSVVADIADAERANQGGRITVDFDTVAARHIRLTLTKPHGESWFWSIHELSVIAPDAPEEVQ